MRLPGWNLVGMLGGLEDESAWLNHDGRIRRIDCMAGTWWAWWEDKKMRLPGWNMMGG